MRILEAVGYDALMRRFGREHPYDPSDRANSNDEAAAHVLDAQRVLGGRWHRVLLEGPEVLDVVLPWHLGEGGGVELIPPTGLTVAAAAARLAALDATYAHTNPLCAYKLTRQKGAPAQPLYLSTRAMPTRDYAALTVREGLVHLDGLHRMLAWHRGGLLAPGRWLEAYVAGLPGAGLAPADVGHGARHDQDGLHVDPRR
ncbi:hypothetical protein EES43_01220 [Streptomyces sp. ADI96-02]|uniref:DUF6309 family protein n=1 Tax=unclassified Streptomyces TaxID=2593676 RepID=UPI000FC048AE|nr:DUF6309 family protein [Streptomyces sp. ADI96-02]RPK68813.1 hypothetical protein EES43_01220 [Streptomyces sp. ADI96-02]